MDIDRLRYFCSIINTGSMVKASELLGISQPALSKAMKILEEEMGRKLLVQAGRGLAPTDHGKKLAQHAAPLIEALFGLRDLDDFKENSKRLKIASFEAFSTYFLGRIIADEFSEFEMNVLELLPGQIEEAIEKGEADIGITYLPIPRPELDLLKITEVQFGIFGRQKKFAGLPLESLSFVAPLNPESGTPTQAKGLDGWPDHSSPRRVQYRTAMMETALDLCRSGKCVGYFPKFVIQLHNQSIKEEYQLKELEPVGAPKKKNQPVYMIKRKSDLESKNFKIISRALRLCQGNRQPTQLTQQNPESVRAVTQRSKSPLFTNT